MNSIYVKRNKVENFVKSKTKSSDIKNYLMDN